MVVFNYTLYHPTLQSFGSMTAEIYRFDATKPLWLIHSYMFFLEPLLMNEPLFDAFIEQLGQITLFKIQTVLNSPGKICEIIPVRFRFILQSFDRREIEYKQSQYINYFTELYPTVSAKYRNLGDLCTADTECRDVNSQCVSSCPTCRVQTANKICACKTGHFQSVNFYNNSMICGEIFTPFDQLKHHHHLSISVWSVYGKKVGEVCSANDAVPCGPNQACTSGKCACKSGYTSYNASCGKMVKLTTRSWTLKSTYSFRTNLSGPKEFDALDWMCKRQRLSSIRQMLQRNMSVLPELCHN